MVSLNMILLLCKGSSLLCLCLRGSLLLQTHQLCDISKAWYDTCFISLAVKGLYFCQMPSYREKVKLFSPRIISFSPALSFEWELFSFNDFFLFAGLRKRDKDLSADSCLHKRPRYWVTQHRIHMLYTDSFQFVLYTCCNFNGFLCLRIYEDFPYRFN